MSDCLFCKIAAGEIPSNKVYEDDQVFAFYDIDPQAPTHFLVIPKAHIGSCGEITADNAGVVAHIFEVISKVTAQLGITDLTYFNVQCIQKLGCDAHRATGSVIKLVPAFCIGGASNSHLIYVNAIAITH